MTPFTPEELKEIHKYLNKLIPNGHMYFTTHKGLRLPEFWISSITTQTLYTSLSQVLIRNTTSYYIGDVLGTDSIERIATEHQLDTSELTSVIRYHSFKSLFFFWGRIQILHAKKYRLLPEVMKRFLLKWDPNFYNYHIQHTMTPTYGSLLNFTCMDTAILEHIKKEIGDQSKVTSSTEMRETSFATLLDNCITWDQSAIAKKIKNGGVNFYSELARIESEGYWTDLERMNSMEKRAIDTFAQFLQIKERVKSAYAQNNMFYTNVPEELMFQ